MAQPITTDNIERSVQDAMRTDINELKNKLISLETLVKEDLALDRTQGRDAPAPSGKIDNVYTKVDELKTLINIFREELKQIRMLVETLLQRDESRYR
jgi:hypothetical protein